MATTVTDNKDLHRYEIRLDGDLAGFTDYHQNGDVMVLIHTEVDQRFRGHGLASELVRSALDDVRARGFAVRPICPLVLQYIQDHAEYQDLVLEADRAEFGL